LQSALDYRRSGPRPQGDFPEKCATSVVWAEIAGQGGFSAGMENNEKTKPAGARRSIFPGKENFF
jgi:hypothetical protein